MRLDKFLKVSRLIKRRTVAKEVCDAGRVTVNDRVAKAGTEVGVGDEISLSLGRRWLRIRVVEIRETVPAQAAQDLYEVLDQTAVDDLG
ncbi:MAG: RNA-binding S4 domain-containing protein [Bacillota bacterium]